jgi:hypothetical protein
MRHSRRNRMSATTGLVLTGGGARAAYQVGALQALAEITRLERHPFPIPRRDVGGGRQCHCAGRRRRRLSRSRRAAGEDLERSHTRPHLPHRRSPARGHRDAMAERPDDERALRREHDPLPPRHGAPPAAPRGGARAGSARRALPIGRPPRRRGLGDELPSGSRGKYTMPFGACCTTTSNSLRSSCST